MKTKVGRLAGLAGAMWMAAATAACGGNAASPAASPTEAKPADGKGSCGAKGEDGKGSCGAKDGDGKGSCGAKGEDGKGSCGAKGGDEPKAPSASQAAGSSELASPAPAEAPGGAT